MLVIFQGKRIGKKKKTSVKSCNLNPYWNESFVFLIDEMDMKRVWLDVTVKSIASIISFLDFFHQFWYFAGLWLRFDW